MLHIHHNFFSILVVLFFFSCFFFFFQAEDGIRDTSVTGVQTCALPISCPMLAEGHSGWKCDADPPGRTKDVVINATSAPIFRTVRMFCVVAPNRTPRQFSSVSATIDAIAMSRIAISVSGEWKKNPM